MHSGIIDTHAHIYAQQFDADVEETISRAKAAGVTEILLPNIDSTSTSGLNQLVAAHPNLFYKMSGLHPCSVKENYLEELNLVKKELRKGDSIAVGEIGIDLHWDKSTKDIQIDAFLQQCKMAENEGLPIVIHSREATDLILDLLEKEMPLNIKGVFHCFTGTRLQAERIRELGFIMGIGGVVTFKNSNLREVLSDVPLSEIVVETDSPYLAPTPYRGKRNESAYIVEVIKTLSMVYSVSEEVIIKKTRENALNLFNI